MAIKNQQIIERQIERINKMAGTDITMVRSNGYCWVCRKQTDDAFFPPLPFSNVLTGRTSAQTIEYLAGLEDAVAYYTKNK